MKRGNLIFLLILLLGLNTTAQNRYTLQSFIQTGLSETVQAKAINIQLELSKNNYLLYKLDLKPEISFSGYLPMYTKQYNSVIQPAGNILFLPVSQNFSTAGFTFVKKLGFSGGLITASTNLARFDDFTKDYTQYNGTPIYLKLNQPLFAINEFKWNNKIELLKSNEADATYLQNRESLSLDCVNLFFLLLDAQDEIKLSQSNYENSKSNYETELKRVSLGTTSEDKILQLELRTLVNKQSIDIAKYNYQMALIEAKSLIGSIDTSFLEFELPINIPDFTIDPNLIILNARKHRPEFIAFERKRIEAEKNVLVTKNMKREINLSASFGYNRAAIDVKSIYTNPQNQQSFGIGVNIPIVDWGKRKIAYNSAKLNFQLISANASVDSINYELELFRIIKSLPLLASNFTLSKTTYEVALKRYQLAINLFKTGRLSITDINIAQNEKDVAYRNFKSNLRKFWTDYYAIRRISIFDVENNIPLH